MRAPLTSDEKLPQIADTPGEAVAIVEHAAQRQGRVTQQPPAVR